MHKNEFSSSSGIRKETEKDRVSSSGMSLPICLSVIVSLSTLTSSFVFVMTQRSNQEVTEKKVGLRIDLLLYRKVQGGHPNKIK